jgi:hypothetical protein
MTTGRAVRIFLAGFLFELSMVVSTHISILNSTCESSDVRRHQYVCGYEPNEVAPEGHLMGERQTGPFQLSFNAAPKVDFQRSRVTSDGSLILVRELDERPGFSDLNAQHLTDSRRGKNTQFPLADLLRHSSRDAKTEILA